MELCFVSVVYHQELVSPAAFVNSVKKTKNIFRLKGDLWNTQMWKDNKELKVSFKPKPLRTSP